MATFKYNGQLLHVRRSEYQFGSCKQLALLAFEDRSCSGIPYGVFTVNLDDPRCEPIDTRYAMQFVDTNNWPGIEEALSDVEWAEHTDNKAQSGYCTYPIWIFDLDQIEHV